MNNDDATGTSAFDEDSSTPRPSRRALDRFSPDFIARLQHVFTLFFCMIICLMMKWLRGSFATVTGSLSVLSKGCESAEETAPPSLLPKNLPTGAEGALNVAKHLIGGKVLSVACYSNTMVYRVSFSAFIYFFIHYLSVSDLTCCIDSESRMKLQTKFKCFKIIVLNLLIFLTMFIPNDFFAWYAQLCMFAGAIFLIMQVVILVDWSHYWNDEWGRRAENNPKWQCYLSLIAIGSYVFGILCTIASYYYYTPQQDCNLHGTIITLNLLFGIGYTIIAIWVPHGSIVPSGIVFAYCTGLSFAMMRGSQNEECNRLYAPGGGSLWMTLATAVVSSFLVAWSALSVGGARESLSFRTGAELAEEDPDESGHLSGYCYFYIIMMLGSMYLSMIVTNWEVSGASGSQGEAQGLVMAFWVRFSTIALTVFLYMWSLLAPYYCCRHRDYGFDTTWE